MYNKESNACRSITCILYRLDFIFTYLKLVYVEAHISHFYQFVYLTHWRTLVLWASPITLRVQNLLPILIHPHFFIRSLKHSGPSSLLTSICLNCLTKGFSFCLFINRIRVVHNASRQYAILFPSSGINNHVNVKLDSFVFLHRGLDLFAQFLENGRKPRYNPFHIQQ